MLALLLVEGLETAGLMDVVLNVRLEGGFLLAILFWIIND